MDGWAAEISAEQLAELEAWDRIERIDWQAERDVIVGLLLNIANSLGAGLDPALFIRPTPAGPGGVVSPDEMVRIARQAFGG